MNIKKIRISFIASLSKGKGSQATGGGYVRETVYNSLCVHV